MLARRLTFDSSRNLIRATVTAYYNEIDPYAAQWLRNLIKAGHIAPGDVDERSIVDVRADDLRGYQQAHFFAGIGGWSVALRLAGWPDDGPVWTGSCPCQPFSAAGAGKAGDDERHLWPAWFPLIAECRPAIVFGEQVEAAIGWGWLDAVFTDMEGEGYACGATVLPACGVGAPHIRQRAWFVANSDGGDTSTEGLQRGGQHGQRSQDGRSGGWLADAKGRDQRRYTGEPRGQASEGRGETRQADGHSVGGAGSVGRMAYSERDGWREGGQKPPRRDERIEPQGTGIGLADDSRRGGVANTKRDGGRADQPERQPQGRIADGWAGAEWLECVDGKARPVEPGTFPLAHGIQRRASKLRAYGNAIVPQVAAEFIKAVSIE